MRSYGEIFRELMRLKGEKPDDVIEATGLGRNTVYDVLNDARVTRRASLERLAKHFGKSLTKVEAMRGATEATGTATIFVDADVARDFARYADQSGQSPSDALRALLANKGGAADARPPRH